MPQLSPSSQEQPSKRWPDIRTMLKYKTSIHKDEVRTMFKGVKRSLLRKHLEEILHHFRRMEPNSSKFEALSMDVVHVSSKVRCQCCNETYLMVCPNREAPVINKIQTIETCRAMAKHQSPVSCVDDLLHHPDKLYRIGSEGTSLSAQFKDQPSQPDDDDDNDDDDDGGDDDVLMDADDDNDEDHDDNAHEKPPTPGAEDSETDVVDDFLDSEDERERIANEIQQIHAYRPLPEDWPSNVFSRFFHDEVHDIFGVWWILQNRKTMEPDRFTQWFATRSRKLRVEYAQDPLIGCCNLN